MVRYQTDSAFRRFLPDDPWLRIATSLLLLLCVLGPFLSHDRPLACRDARGWRYPVLESVGLTSGSRPMAPAEWKEECTRQVWPLIPYLPTNVDARHVLLPPFSSGVTQHRHWLGTDALGRDVAAGLLAGVRTACFTGILAALLALFIGVLLGAAAGFFGDHMVRIHTIEILLFPLLLVWTAYLATWLEPAACLLVFLAGGAGILVFSRILKQKWDRRWTLPLDSLVMRFSEVVQSLPALFVLMAFSAALPGQGGWMVILILGLFSWPGIARIMRTEMRQVYTQEYITAATVSGLPPWRIFFRHALPNALAPAFALFGVLTGSAILLESSLSFLGITSAASFSSWGNILSQAKDQIGAWWLAVLPGVCITLTLLLCNRYSEYYQQREKGILVRVP